MIHRHLSRTIFACLAIGSAAHANACSTEMGDDFHHYEYRVGAYVLGSSTQIRADSANGRIGTELDFEDDLNLDEDKGALLVSFQWRINPCHMLDVSHFRLRRSGTSRVDGELSFGETDFPVGADLRSTFTTEVTRLSYSYTFLNKKDWLAAASIGLHVTRLKSSIAELQFDSVDQPIENLEIAEITAPLPVLGFTTSRRLSEKWRASFRGQWFFLEVDEIGGSVSHASIYAVHQTFDKVSLGFGYDWFDVSVDVDERFWKGTADVRFNGPLVMLQGRF